MGSRCLTTAALTPGVFTEKENQKDSTKWEK